MEVALEEEHEFLWAPSAQLKRIDIERDQPTSLHRQHLD